ncbi:MULTISPECIES: diacylglycerol kinase family protein [Arthrobacter]|uniref:Diacylglycerol kinase family protein n=2 Tax=Arthrobacter TaxID=1663 RepID=A0ABU9KJP8_9MICC|nr:diacylglycerol kinase family protein [Arthrobacter sp. YJM1]MDP5227207.1 diacylglycerol kinase family protein [Arthrobacter sp. YJM1]
MNRNRTVKPGLPDGRRVLLVVNPAAGGADGFRRARLAAEVFRAAGAQVTVLEPAVPDGLPELLDRAADDADALVAVGGDGLVQCVAEAALRRGLPLGIVPAGTGNDAARALRLPKHPRAAARRAVAGWANGGRPADVARVTLSDGAVRHFLTALAAGFDAVVNERANSWRRPRGGLKYVLALLACLPSVRPVRYRLRVHGVAEETTAVILTVANGPSFGGGLRIAPAARLDDGALDLVTVDPIPRLALLTVFPLAFAGLHVLHPAVHIRRVRHVTIVSGGPRCYADGEPIGLAPLEVDVLPGALTVLA